MYCMKIVLSKNNDDVSTLQFRVGKTGPFGPWSRVMVYCCNKLSFCQNDPPIALGDHFGKRTACYNTYTMTLLKGSKDPVLPTLIYILYCTMQITKRTFKRTFCAANQKN